MAVDRAVQRVEHAEQEATCRRLVGRLAHQGRLAPGWTVETALDLATPASRMGGLAGTAGTAGSRPDTGEARGAKPQWCAWHIHGASVVSVEIVVVHVDRQGRLVLPRRLRDGLVDVPGRVVVRRTAEGLLLTPDRDAGAVRASDDGLPVLDLDRPISNTEVLAAIDEDRAIR